MKLTSFLIVLLINLTLYIKSFDVKQGPLVERAQVMMNKPI